MITAEIKADSFYGLSNHLRRLTTFEITIPREVLPEFTRHRIYSYSVESMRAVSVKNKLKEMKSGKLYIPKLGKEQKGMNIGDEFTNEERVILENAWIDGASYALKTAEFLVDNGVHHSIPNYILAPFMYVRMYVTGTEWNNFFNLRLSPHAHPAMREIAQKMKAAINSSTPEYVNYGFYHIPNVIKNSNLSMRDRLLDTAAQIARVSYNPSEREYSVEDNLKLANRLIEDNHWSPFEHIARPKFEYEPQVGNFPGWIQYRHELSGEAQMYE